jgi:hypothetical protein
VVPLLPLLQLLLVVPDFLDLLVVPDFHVVLISLRRLRLCCIPSSTSFFSFLLSSELRTHQTAVVNKMVLLRDVQGKVYKFKSRSDYLGLGMLTPDVLDVVRSHMVLVLGIVPGKLDYVKVMTVST